MSFLAKITSGNEFFLRIFPLIALIIVLVITPLLNKEIDDTPFFGVILIKIVLYLGSCQYTILGEIGVTLLTLSGTVIIIALLVFITFFQIEEPVNHIQGMLLGLIIILAEFIVNITIYGWRVDFETWAIIYIAISFIGILLIQKKYSLIGALPILIIALLNDYVISFALSGFDAGSELMKFFSLFLTIYAILNLR